MDQTLPEIVYTRNNANPNQVIAIKRGVSGFFPIQTLATPEVLNELRGATEAQILAMEIGSMFGWDVPGAYAASHEGQV